MDAAVLIRFVLALALVIGLIMAAGWAARRFGLGTQVAPARGRAKRLAIVEVAALDVKRRLVLVKRDEREHLLLLGGPSDLVVEKDIVRMEETESSPSEHGAPA